MLRYCKAYTAASKLISGPNVQSKLQSTVDVIEKALHLKTVRAKVLHDCEIKDFVTSRPIMSMKASEEVIEVPIDEFSNVIGYYDESIVSSYCTRTGRIFLVKGKWCFSNLIHEALHSRSVFSKEYPPPTNLKFISEGLTELLVGLVLMEKIPSCYEIWHANKCFSSDYIPFIKPWYYLTFKMDFNPIISLFFDTKEKKPYDKLGRTLQKQLDRKIQNVFRNYKAYGKLLFANFLDELGVIFPIDFAQFQSLSPTIFELDHLKKPI